MSEAEKLLSKISEKLDKLVRLLAVVAVRGEKREKDKIQLLDSLGFRPIEIGRMLNKDPHNVVVTLGEIREKSATKTDKKRGADQENSSLSERSDLQGPTATER